MAADETTRNAASTSGRSPLTDGVRRSLEDAKSQAERNIQYLSQEIDKAEREIENLRLKIESYAEEQAANKASLIQAEAMLGESLVIEDGSGV